MAALIRVPEVAAGATEVVLGEWLVQRGDALSHSTAIAVLETDKATVEIEAEAEGVFLHPMASPNDTIAIGSPLALVGSEKELDEDPAILLDGLGMADRAASPHGPAVSPQSSAVSGNGAPHPVPTAVVAGRAQTTEASTVADSAQRRFVSPIARKLLAEAGLSLEAVTGTGPGGRIIRRDVEHALADQPSTARKAATSADKPDTTADRTSGSSHRDVPHDKVRRAIARHLTLSKQTTPHFYLKRTVRVQRLISLRRSVNDEAGVQLSLNDYLLKAVGTAYRSVPEANVIWTEDCLRYFDHVDIGVAVASERGLVTPVLRDVANSSLGAIHTSVRAFVEDATKGRLQQRDLEGGVLTVSNLGMYGVEEFSAIINPPQSAILAVGASRPAAVVTEDGIQAEECLDLTLSVDHRAVDGALAATWLQALVDALEHPMRLVV